jgi:hypothetical protein
MGHIFVADKRQPVDARCRALAGSTDVVTAVLQFWGGH